MPHLGDAAHARADLQSKRESVHAREARWLRRTAHGGAADYSSTHHQEPAARGLKDGDAERLRERAVQEDSPAHEHVPHLLCRCSQGAPRAAAANGRLATGSMQRSVRRRNLNGDHRCTSACTPCACTRARVCATGAPPSHGRLRGAQRGGEACDARASPPEPARPTGGTTAVGEAADPKRSEGAGQCAL
jgi:hypothetical protein